MLVVAASFLGYGFSCIFSDRMQQEFIRFGLEKWRVFTGILQILGALGLAIGVKISMIGAIAALGLALLMFLGFLTRLKINDGIKASAPSFILMLLNAYLSYCNFQLL